MTPTVITSTPNLVAPLTWAISSGTLPTGLSFNTSTGVISGTPSEVIAAPGRQVVVRATDVGGLTGFQTITFQINPQPELYAFTSATFTPGGASGTQGPNITQARSGVGNPPWAPTYLNMSVNGVMLWTVPRTATYRIQCIGAGGGEGGSTGISVQGDVSLTQGAVLKLVVGQAGQNVGKFGGGGGSYVATNANSPIMVAGGGGGTHPGFGVNGNMSATVSNNGQVGLASGGSSGGSGGGGGTGQGSGGSGFFGNGSGNNAGGSPGTSFVNNALGGSGGGGFGGGGGATNSYGGGGGGYSGGGGGGNGQPHSGGGGGSWQTGTNQSHSSNVRSGNGSIVITRL
jgi:hypothetical protein